VDSLLVLLDCGWDDRYDVKLLKPLKDVLGHVDFVLLSHPDPQHLGALPYLVPSLALLHLIQSVRALQLAGCLAAICTPHACNLALQAHACVIWSHSAAAIGACQQAAWRSVTGEQVQCPPAP
jgi:metal-dependent hydrolase (beta-lactamase superfamily II)